MSLAEPIEATLRKIVHYPQREAGTRRTNIGEMERLLSIVAGVPATIFGLTRGTLTGLAAPTVLGSSLILRGITGHSFLYDMLGVNTVHHPAAIVELPNNQGIQVKRAVTVIAAREDLYRNWRNFQNAPRFMTNIESVQVTGNRHLHWVMKTPLGMTIEWDAEITSDEPDRLIAWRKTQGHFLAPTGDSVHFDSKRSGRENVVRREIEFRQFQGPIGTMLGHIVVQIVEQAARQDLERFKELMETGEIATTAGQPSCRRI